jgi:hypothetical protein
MTMKLSWMGHPFYFGEGKDEMRGFFAFGSE